MDIDYSTEGTEFTGLARGLGEGLAGIKAEQKEKDNRAYAESVRQIEFEMDLQKLQMAHAWDLEKMAIRSQSDFARDERKRQQGLDFLESNLRMILDSDEIPEDKKEFYAMSLKLKVMSNYHLDPRDVFPEDYSTGDDSMKLLIESIKKKKERELGDAGQPETPDGTQPNLVPMTDPDGKLKMVHQESVEEALQTGWTMASTEQPTGYKPPAMGDPTEAGPLGIELLHETAMGPLRHSPAGDAFLKQTKFNYIRDRFNKVNK